MGLNLTMQKGYLPYWLVVFITVIIMISTSNLAAAKSIQNPAEGDLVSFGNNLNRQLGLGDPLIELSPKAIDTIEGVTAVAAGAGHSLLLTKNGDVYSFGNNVCGQLGHGENIDSQTTPRLISDIAGARAMALGHGISFIILQDGGIYSCGYNGFGQLGQGDTVDLNLPTRISSIT
jgi:alpha-tubulin suppressor-like RCC1 family protein